MKRKSLRTLVCALLASLALTTFAFADNGPKPQLIVRVKNAPQEPYYLDLLAKGDWDAEDGNRIDGIDWNYDGKEDTLDPDLLALLRDNVPAGWHACVAQGTTGAPMWGELYAEGTLGVRKQACEEIFVSSKFPPFNVRCSIFQSYRRKR